MALAARARRTEFSSLDIAWSGKFLVEREVYLERKTDTFFIAMGFFKFAGLVLPCKEARNEMVQFLRPHCIRSGNWQDKNMIRYVGHLSHAGGIGICLRPITH